MRPAVFLDRDGVLNQAIVREGRPYPPRSVEDLELLPGVAGACAHLRAAGYLLIVVTNQPDLARGAQEPATVEAIHRALLEQLLLDDVRICPHDDADRCSCRKPKPGLLVEAARDWNVDLARSVMVGDRWRDIEAGRSAGCRTVFIDHGYAERRPREADLVVTALADAVPWIIRSAR